MRLGRRAGIWALDYLYAAWHQVRAAFSRDRPESLLTGSGSLAPVVLIPGIFETWRFLLPLARHVHRLGHPVHVVAALGLNRTTLSEGADLVATYLETHDLREVAIIAHSKGGLIAKHLLSTPEGASRVGLVIAVSTPFGGSAYARYFPVRSVRALAPTDAALLRLAGDRAVNERIVSVYGWFDPHIPGGSELIGARNVRVPVGGHFRILGSRPLLDVIDDCLSPSRRPSG
ncbi:esterase/lipase family protein [Leifsonia sp. NPDC058230]|uniref:esterase/lipase family protein n=1 Tax=Leifsonia sp. NPDC058230 TaxID=3346391 RepID=UPI0036DAB127